MSVNMGFMKEICKTCKRFVDETEFSEMMEIIELEQIKESSCKQNEFLCLDCIRLGLKDELIQKYREYQVTHIKLNSDF